MKKRHILLLLVLVLNFISFGTEEVYTVIKDHTSFSTSSSLSLSVEDGRFEELGGTNFSDKSETLYLKFGINERVTHGYLGDFNGSITSTVNVFGIDEDGIETQVIANEILSISYQGLSGGFDIQTSVLEHSGYHKYRIEMGALNLPTGLTAVPPNVYVEANLHIDRYYEISQELPLVGAKEVFYENGNTYKTLLQPQNASPSVNANEIEIYWDYIEGAEEYELEWTWIDNYDVTAALSLSERSFELNNTRILTNKQTYTIPLTYAKGYLVYRVRGVGRWIDNGFLDLDKAKFGVWST